MIGTHEILPRASIGTAVGTNDVGAAELLRNADVAMYDAKAQGNCEYKLFAASMVEGNVARMLLATDLRHAVEDGCSEFELHYQPIINLVTGDLRAAEALARWRHPEKGLVPPGEFIPVAEATGLIIPLGRWLLSEACRCIRELQTSHEAAADLQVSVNLSIRQLHDPTLVDDLARVLDTTGLDPGALTLEITESMLMIDVEMSLRRLTELKALGVDLALDDFGIGCSSLGYLRQFPVDVLKVDKDFIDDVADVESDTAGIARAVITLGHALGLRVVAEGIEHLDQMAQLHRSGCDLGQGFLIARPMTADALED